MRASWSSPVFTMRTTTDRPRCAPPTIPARREPASIAFADGTEVSFSAFVKSHVIGAAEVDGAVGFGATLRITGGVTVSTGD